MRLCNLVQCSAVLYVLYSSILHYTACATLYYATLYIQLHVRTSQGDPQSRQGGIVQSPEVSRRESKVTES
jgi:hypothetical protein